MIKKTLILQSPLFTDWSPQYARLYLEGVEPGAAVRLTVDGEATPFQFTGAKTEEGSEVLLRIGFARGQTRRLVFSQAGACETDLETRELAFSAPVSVGSAGCELELSPRAPFTGFAGFPMRSQLHCEEPLVSARLERIAQGPLFTDFRLRYEFGPGRVYQLRFRSYRLDPIIEVEERFNLGPGGGMTWVLNPERIFTHAISRESFSGESQPSVEALGETRPGDVLCRLQMPVLGEYYIPNNRGWFAFYDRRDEKRGMIGILGTDGAQWRTPVASMPEIRDCGGTLEWRASLESGVRRWLLYAGAVETAHTPERRLVFHRLHAEFNALRLDGHWRLDGSRAFDHSVATQPGFFEAGDYHEAARRRAARLPMLAEALRSPTAWMRRNGALHTLTYRYLIGPSPALARELHALLLSRFERWVRQFQGWRTGEPDFGKNVIGFSRHLREMLLAYEMLRRDGALREDQVNGLNAFFAFAAQRILDEGRWPHSRTTLHPDHPESTRDFYTYGGEHKPDRLYWSNSLPNFQGDPLCALAHLAAIFTDHPDAEKWRSFALDDLDRQLDAYCGESGAWEESINYALYTLSYFVITFRALKHRCGIDYFRDERVRRLVGWLCRFLGPNDRRWDRHTFPGVGNAVCPTRGGEYLFCYAAELPADDPLRRECLAVWQRLAGNSRPQEHYLTVLAAMAPEADDGPIPLTRRESERMDEVGIALRDRHTEPGESYLFQKIGFAKDHYENDESAFNWYAKGVPFCMDYGTYTGDMGVAAAHNLVEIPEMDALRRGYVASSLFTGAVDFTHCEMPVTLKLLWGRIRSFPEIDGQDGVVHREKTPYHYIGDRNPVGPKCWKVRKLLFVKPDYIVLFDRVYGEVAHRYNLHFTGEGLERKGRTVTGRGRFDLDLLLYVQHPARFRMETGETLPGYRPEDEAPEANRPHSQHHLRLYNEEDGIYRTLLFARERSRAVQTGSVGRTGIRVAGDEYTDYLFLHDEVIAEETEEVSFFGRSGWIRRWKDGRVSACLIDGERLGAFGLSFEGRGPWTYGVNAPDRLDVLGPTPRTVRVRPR